MRKDKGKDCEDEIMQKLLLIIIKKLVQYLDGYSLHKNPCHHTKRRVKKENQVVFLDGVNNGTDNA
jgi:hypothetical protein